MPFPLALGGTQAALQTAQVANNSLVKPAVGSAAQSAAGFAGAMQTAAAKTAAKATGQAAAQQAQNSLNAFHQTFMQLLTNAKVDTSQPIQLKSDGLGGVEVAGNPTDSDKITTILNDHPELVAQFQALSQTFTKLRAADPTSAAADKLHPPVFGITINGQQVQPTFQ